MKKTCFLVSFLVNRFFRNDKFWTVGEIYNSYVFLLRFGNLSFSLLSNIFVLCLSNIQNTEILIEHLIEPVIFDFFDLRIWSFCSFSDIFTMYILQNQKLILRICGIDSDLLSNIASAYIVIMKTGIVKTKQNIYEIRK